MVTVHKHSLESGGNDLKYWLTKTPAERISALEEMRYRYIKFFKNGSDTRLQRVCTIVKQK
jgi:hypothetical protein